MAMFTDCTERLWTSRAIRRRPRGWRLAGWWRARIRPWPRGRKSAFGVTWVFGVGHRRIVGSALRRAGSVASGQDHHLPSRLPPAAPPARWAGALPIGLARLRALKWWWTTRVGPGGSVDSGIAARFAWRLHAAVPQHQLAGRQREPPQRVLAGDLCACGRARTVHRAAPRGPPQDPGSARDAVEAEELRLEPVDLLTAQIAAFQMAEVGKCAPIINAANSSPSDGLGLGAT